MKSRELNPELFGFKSLQSQKTEQVLQEATESFKHLAPMIEPLESEFQDQLGQLQIDFEQTQLEQKAKIEKLQLAMARLEKIHNSFVQDITGKYQALLQQNAEQKMDHQKIQALMERHSQILNGYEVRLSQLQKVLSMKEKEIELLRR